MRDKLRKFFMSDAGVPSIFLRFVRRVNRKFASSTAARIISTLRARLGGHDPRTWLLISDCKEYTSEQQFAPLRRHRQGIASQLGIVFRFEHTSIVDRLTVADLSGVDVVGIKLSFRTPPALMNEITHKLKLFANDANARFVTFDGDDDLCVLWPTLIEATDVYVKKHRFAEDDAHGRAYVGKSNLTDYVNHTYGVSFSEDIIPKSEALSETSIQKIVPGWNIAHDDKIVDLSKDVLRGAGSPVRTIDLLCRASVKSAAWTYEMRECAVTALEAIAERHSVQAPRDRVPQAEYYQEILKSRITVSPFGFGEVCWRDFEAILCGSLLVKPDMSHAQTWPNIYVPYETYIPVSWDYSNLEAVCAPYLADEAERKRVAEAARLSLLNSLKSEEFVGQFASLAKRIANE